MNQFKVEMNTKQKIILSFKTYGIALLITIAFAGISKLLFNEVTIFKKIPYNDQLFMVFMALIIAPITEEMIFRYVIVDFFNKKRLRIASSIMIIASIYLYFKNHIIDIRFYIFGFWFLVMWVCYFFNKSYNFEKNKSFATITIISSSFLFSLAHMENYTVVNGHYSYLFMFCGLFCIGILLSRVRLKAGVGWSMFTHFLINLVGGLNFLYLHFR